MLRIITTTLVLMMATCSNPRGHIKSIDHFNKGEMNHVEEFDEDIILSGVKGLIKEANQTISLIVTPEFIEKIKNENECVEIVFDSPQTFSDNFLSETVIEKILIPLSGKYIGNINSPSVIIFLGNRESYRTGPRGCENCLMYVDKIKVALSLKKSD